MTEQTLPTTATKAEEPAAPAAGPWAEPAPDPAAPGRKPCGSGACCARSPAGAWPWWSPAVSAPGRRRWSPSRTAPTCPASPPPRTAAGTSPAAAPRPPGGRPAPRPPRQRGGHPPRRPARTAGHRARLRHPGQEADRRLDAHLGVPGRVREGGPERSGRPAPQLRPAPCHLAGLDHARRHRGPRPPAAVPVLGAGRPVPRLRRPLRQQRRCPAGRQPGHRVRLQVAEPRRPRHHLRLRLRGARPYGDDEVQTRVAYIVAGDTLGMVVHEKKGGADRVPFHQTVVLQTQLLS